MDISGGYAVVAGRKPVCIVGKTMQRYRPDGSDEIYGRQPEVAMLYGGC